MSVVRIFVSYAIAGDEQGAKVARQLISDLQANGAEVVSDSEAIPEENFIKFLNQELPRCHYLVLIQTPLALASLRVQTSMNIALNLVAQQRLKGVLRLVAVPTDDIDEQPLWITPRAFDASRDYPRARDKVLLELNLLSLDDELPEPLNQAAPLSPVASTITLTADGSSEKRPDALWHDKVTQQAPTLADRPVALPTLLSKRRLWISIISAVLILLMVLTLGVTMAQSRNHSPIVANSSLTSGKAEATRPPQGTSQPVSPPTATPTPQSTATPTPTTLPVHRTIIDSLNDWSKIYSHTPNLDLDHNNSQWMHGDTSLLYRTKNTAEKVVWKLPGMTSFKAITYFWPPQDNSPLHNLITSISADGVHWTAITPTLSNGGGNWTEYTYMLRNLSGVNFVRMSWSVTSDNYWGQQIGQVTLKS